MSWPQLVQKKKKGVDVPISLYEEDKPKGGFGLRVPNYYGVKPIEDDEDGEEE